MGKAGYSSVGRASGCRSLQQSDGPCFDSGWSDFSKRSLRARHKTSLASENIKREQKMRMPGGEPGSQAWEACMMPLHYMRYSFMGSLPIASCDLRDVQWQCRADERDGVMPATHARGHCSSFWLMFPSLEVAPRFACSVASLSRCPGH